MTLVLFPVPTSLLSLLVGQQNAWHRFKESHWGIGDLAQGKGTKMLGWGEGQAGGIMGERGVDPGLSPPPPLDAAGSPLAQQQQDTAVQDWARVELFGWTA